MKFSGKIDIKPNY